MEAADEEVESLITKEYPEQVMSSDLPCKFPHSSAFGFDYSQSSIWSPLIPRPHIPVASDGPITPKKLSYGSRVENKLHNTRNKSVASAFRFGRRVMQNSRSKKMKMSRTSHSKSPDLSPTLMMAGACVPLAAKVLKAASKHFKKKKKKRKDPMDHVKLSNYLKADNV